MNDQLLKIEEILLEHSSGNVLLAGAILLIMGLFLWLGGLKYLKLVSGMLGGAGGALLGTVVSGMFEWSPAITIGASAAIFAIGAVLLQQLLIILVAATIFAAIFGGGYLEYTLNRINTEDTDNYPDSRYYQDYEYENHAREDTFHADNPFDSARQISENADRLHHASDYVGSFIEELQLVFSDLSPTMSDNSGYLILWCVVGGVIGLILAQLLKTIVMALCCSIVGTTSTISGIIIAIISKGTPLWTNMQGHGRFLAMVFFTMIVFGWFFQMITGKKIKKSSNPEKSSKE